jgi:hypothetical protein
LQPWANHSAAAPKDLPSHPLHRPQNLPGHRILVRARPKAWPAYTLQALPASLPLVHSTTAYPATNGSKRELIQKSNQRNSRSTSRPPIEHCYKASLHSSSQLSEPDSQDRRSSPPRSVANRVIVYTSSRHQLARAYTSASNGRCPNNRMDTCSDACTCSCFAKACMVMG